MSLRTFPMLFVAAVFLSAPVVAQPKLGEQKFFKNWAAACDNTLSCEAVSLEPENFPSDGLSLSMSRDATSGAIKITIFSVDTSSDRYRLLVDRRTILSGAINKDSEPPITVTGPDALRLARSLAKGSNLVVMGNSGAILGTISLAGSSAALRHMDAVQNRIGTRDAIVAIGRKKSAANSIPAPVLSVKRIKPIETVPDATTLVGLIESSACADERFGVTEDSAYSLGRVDGKAQAIVLISCGSGAYNFAYAAFIGSEDAPGKWSFAPASFDYDDEVRTMDKSLALLINADWDSSGQTLSTHGKGRGIGDCGSSETYVWDGTMFRLISAYGMDECRGSMEWMTLWRAEVKLVD